MKTRLLRRALAGAAALTLVGAPIALASSVDVSVVDVTTPFNAVAIAPGNQSPITLNLTVTGNQVGTATFEVYRNWTLSGGTFTGSTAQEFTVAPRVAQDPPTTFSTTGTITVAAGQAAGTFTLEAGAFDITNDNSQGAKLAAGATSSYAVTVPAPSDTTGPDISYTLNPASPDGDNGWYTGNVVLDWTVADNESSISASSGCDDMTIASDQAATAYTCEATSAGGKSSVTTVPIKRDATPPSVSYTGRSGTLGNNGWYRSPVTATFTATDLLSGPASQTGQATSASNAEGETVVIESPSFSDVAGNSAPAGAASHTVKIDLTDPSVEFDNTFSGSYVFGAVPAAPTCIASDAISGLAGDCVVTGYSTGVGTHIVTATATDNAGRTAEDKFEYEVLAWTRTGFYQPVDMGDVVNTVKNGSTVPLKFEVFAGSTELTSTSAVKSFTQMKVACDFAPTLDEIEVTSTGGTSLRYDTTGGQFIQNWQTPKAPGACYVVTLTTQDDRSMSAKFKLK